MVSVDRLQSGIQKYVDNAMLPKMTGAQRWIVAVAVGLYADKLPQILQQCAENPMIKSLGIISPDGVEVETAYKYLKQAAKSGSATFQVPLLGSLTFSESDVDMLYQFIVQ